jgi:hypothetical protein
MSVRRDGMIKYDYRPGMLFLKELEGGHRMPQVFSAPIDGAAPAMPMFTDDMIFAQEKKKKLFQIDVIITSIEEIKAAEANLVEVDKLSANKQTHMEATKVLNLTPKAFQGSDCLLHRAMCYQSYYVYTTCGHRLPDKNTYQRCENGKGKYCREREGYEIPMDATCDACHKKCLKSAEEFEESRRQTLCNSHWAM